MTTLFIERISVLPTENGRTPTAPAGGAIAHHRITERSVKRRTVNHAPRARLRRLPGCAPGAPGRRRRTRAGSIARRHAHRGPAGDAVGRLDRVWLGNAGADRPRQRAITRDR